MGSQIRHPSATVASSLDLRLQTPQPSEGRLGDCADMALRRPAGCDHEGMAECELTGLQQAGCDHCRTKGRADPRNEGVVTLQISPTGFLHFEGCPHKGDDEDFKEWAYLDTPQAWQRVGNGERLPATRGSKMT